MVRHYKTFFRDYDVVVTYSLSKRITGVRFLLDLIGDGFTRCVSDH